MAERKKTGRAPTAAPDKKRKAGSRTTGNVSGGTRSTTREQRRPSEELGKWNVNKEAVARGTQQDSPSDIGVVGSDRWDGERMRAGIRLPGDTASWLEEAAHYLSMAICHYLGHVGKPCSACVRWAEQELAFAVSQKGVIENDSNLLSLGHSLAGFLGGSHFGDSSTGVVSRGVQAGSQSHRNGRKNKGTKQPRTKKS